MSANVPNIQGHFYNADMGNMLYFEVYILNVTPSLSPANKTQESRDKQYSLEKRNRNNSHKRRNAK